MNANDYIILFCHVGGGSFLIMFLFGAIVSGGFGLFDAIKDRYKK